MTYQRDFTFHEKKMCKSLREIKRNQVRMQMTAPKYLKDLKILIFLVQKMYFALRVWLFKRVSSEADVIENLFPVAFWCHC